MSRWLVSCVAVLALVVLSACGESKPSHSGNVAQFWRPVSEPNLLMSLDKAQHKLNFDVSQCRCGIYPLNTTRDEAIDAQKDKQRLAQTGQTITPNQEGNCVQNPSMIVAECMRQRGWEETHCSGRMPLAGGGSLCAAYKY